MIGVKLPDGRTISVQTDDPQEAAKAGRRVLAREAILKGPQGGQKNAGKGLPANGVGDAMTDNMAHNATFGLDDVFTGGITAGVTGLKNLVGRARGQQPTYGASDAYAAERGLLKERRAKFSEAHPVLSGGSGLLGAVASPVGGPVSDFIANGAKTAKTGVGLLDGLLHSSRLPAQVVRGSLASAPLGALAGAAEADPGQEGQGAISGGQVGALTGAAFPVAGAVVGKVAGAAKGAGTALVRATNKASGGRLLDATKTASQRLTEALKADGASPADLKAALNVWLKTGASSPSLMDLATKLPSGGANTMRLLTGAAMKGKAAGAAGQYADDVATALPDNVIARARKLTPDTRPAAKVADELKTTQRGLADEQYQEPYATPVEVTPEVHAALRDEPGQAALRRAIKGAVARQDYDSAGRLHTLLQDDIPDMPGFNMDRVRAGATKAGRGAEVTAGDLDRVRIAMGERGEGALRGQAPARDVAGGLFGRAKQIDAGLDQVPEIQPARQTYKAVQGQRDAVDAGQGALQAFPDEYEAELARLRGRATPDDNPHPVSAEDIGGAAAVGHRQAITDAVGAPAAGSTGVLNRLRGSPNMIRNQDATFGPDEAGGFRDAVSNELTRVKNARQIDPTLNSRTAGRLDALADIEKPHVSAWGIVAGLVNKVRQGATLTEDERNAIIRLGLSQPHVLDTLHEAPQPVLDAITRSGAYLAAPGAEQAGKAVSQ